MDMEGLPAGAAAAQGNLADVVARASVAVVPSCFTATQHRRPPHPAAAAPAMTSRRRYHPAGGHIVGAVSCDEEPRPVGCVDAVMFEAAPVDPYLQLTSVAYGLPPPQYHQHLQLPVQIPRQACCGDGDGDDVMTRISAPKPAAHHQIIKRKSEVRKVVCIPAPPPATSGRSAGGGGGGGGEVIPSDLWAWRKYGQKPIKGSPHPRGYYRCSSSKGCQARKQVERSRSDPSMLVITYTAEHDHPWPMQRNALAGYARAHHTQSSPSSSSSASKKHRTASNSGSSSSYPVDHHHPAGQDDVVGGGDQAAATVVADGIIDGVVVAAGDEVFAELEELMTPPLWSSSMQASAPRGW